MSSHGALAYEVVQRTRPVVLASTRVVEARWRAHGITVAMRAVLERLVHDGPRTVPDLARTLDISRQAVQRSIDELAAQGHVAPHPNPAHRRSPLFDVTPSARRTFDELHAEEVDRVATIAADLSLDDLATARRVLEVLHAGIAAEVARLTEEAPAR
ncbi:MarR family winged helix-turn-helix transcriptional regulator [Actinomarinicola tropica]|uniref:MarR family transcriptional regulator n=1 Tax=Actinomarinicola tropica TaxID=2789776 RepID=A0A5Q2RQ26_9ACTN|nr:helix-turn-helix domain-containing protein [Actinomarinicola tropica]QGG96671.1 MarR family transcriptional regulator [Actinomarinicola tropica]